MKSTLHICWLSLRKKGWRLFDSESKQFVVSCDAVFCETKIPYDAASLHDNTEDSQNELDDRRVLSTEQGDLFSSDATRPAHVISAYSPKQFGGDSAGKT